MKGWQWANEQMIKFR